MSRSKGIPHVEAPPALADVPQFHPEFWAKVQRQTLSTKIAHVIHKDNGYTEIAIDGGMAFLRKRKDIKQLLTKNLAVNIEYLANESGQLVTGLFVPQVGWAFRMSNEDLAEYSRQLAAAEHQRQRNLRELMQLTVAEKMRTYLEEHCEYLYRDEGSTWVRVDGEFDLVGLADAALQALAEGPKK